MAIHIWLEGNQFNWILVKLVFTTATSSSLLVHVELHLSMPGVFYAVLYERKQQQLHEKKQFHVNEYANKMQYAVF